MNFLSPDDCSCANVDPESALIMLIWSPRVVNEDGKKDQILSMVEDSMWHLTLPACDCDTDQSTTNWPPFSYYFHDPSTRCCKVLLLDEFQCWLKLPSRDAHSLLATLWQIRSTMHRKIVIIPCHAHRVYYRKHSQDRSEASNFIDYKTISEQLVPKQIPDSLCRSGEFLLLLHRLLIKFCINI